MPLIIQLLKVPELFKNVFSISVDLKIWQIWWWRRQERRMLVVWLLTIIIRRIRGRCQSVIFTEICDAWLWNNAVSVLVLVYIGNYVITYLGGIKSKLFTLVLTSVIVGLTPFGVREGIFLVYLLVNSNISIELDSNFETACSIRWTNKEVLRVWMTMKVFLKLCMMLMMAETLTSMIFVDTLVLHWSVIHNQTVNNHISM